MVPFVFQYFTKWNLGFFMNFDPCLRVDCIFSSSDLQGDRRSPQEKSDTSDEDETENKPETTGSSSSAPDQDLLHKMFVFRFKLMQFINSIHNHFMTRVSYLTLVLILLINMCFQREFLLLILKIKLRIRAVCIVYYAMNLAIPENSEKV